MNEMVPYQQFLKLKELPMPLPAPSYSDVLKISSDFGFKFETFDRDVLMSTVDNMISSYRFLDAMPNPYREVTYSRTLGSPPKPEENPLNAWAWRCSIKGSEDGILKGKKLALKDNISLAGIPLMNGTRVLEGFIPREDATVVYRVLEAGGEIIGKAVCESFCFSGGSHTSEPMPVLNSHDHEYMAGGSSTGCAALLSSGAVDLAIGGDQGGSVRMPASWSGIVGLKATYGLVPYTGIMPIEGTLDHAGPMARSVSDVALLLQAIAGPDGMDPRQVSVVQGDYVGAAAQDCNGLRVGLLKESFEWEGRSDPEVSNLIKQSAEKLKKDGVSVQEISIPGHKDGVHIWNGIAIEGATAQMVVGNGSGWNWKGHYNLDLVDFYSRSRKRNGSDFPWTVQLVATLGQYMADKYGGHYYAKSQNLGRALANDYDRALENLDVLILPTTPMTAMKLNTDQALPEYLDSALGMIQNTCPFDFTGHPAISVPCGKIDGMPVGLMVVGRRFDEASVLRIASAIEKLTQ